jgi:hypothetical protein
MALNHHIIALDLLTIKTKKKVYEVMERSTIGDQRASPNKVVFVLDEFDLTVTALYNKKKNDEARKQLFYEYTVNRWDNESFGEYSKRKISSESKSPSESASARIVIENREKTEMKQSVEEDLDTTENIALDDLLTIIQGPVPLNRAIIIATTNKYDEINKMCPALFRPGRLTPIYFG